MKYSVIIPVYNRIAEVDYLLRSLAQQTCKDFEVIIVEDGSSEPCEDVVKEHEDKVDVKYFFKENEGRSIARNYGMEHAQGEYFIFFDSDCIIPPSYFDHLNEALEKNPVDCFGGPDAADESFSDVQKAINYSMTSFLTTGGIRGGAVQLEKFTPRTFNMGFSRKVYETVGGFREMFSEDIDMSMRIKNAGFSVALIRPAVVFHKRRVNFRKFFRQVYVFGMSRITLKLLYPNSMKLVHCLPALAVLASIVLIVLSVTVSPWFIAPIVIYLIAIFIAAYLTTEDPWISTLALPASVIQISGYGLGFIKAYVEKIILRRGRNVEEEIKMRKGK